MLRVHDRLYGLMTFTTFLAAVVDTPEFQRLQHIQQLGLASSVFRGVTHSRKAHSLGTCYLAGKWMRHLQRHHAELPITDRLVELVQLAALLHDTGHMPFSHAFDRLVPILKPSKHTTHEERSVVVLQRLRERGVVTLSDAEEKLVAGLITGCRGTGSPEYLYSLVACDLDVDRLDYLKRDGAHAGRPANFQVDRIIAHSRIVSGRLAFHDRVADEIFLVFATRFRFHKELYQHENCKILEVMLAEAVKRLPEPAQRFLRQVVEDPDRWHLMTDGSLWGFLLAFEDSYQIVSDIEDRRLWPSRRCSEDKCDPAHLVTAVFNFGHGKDNPLRHLWFFDPWVPERTHRWNPSWTPADYPTVFQEKTHYEVEIPRAKYDWCAWEQTL